MAPGFGNGAHDQTARNWLEQMPNPAANGMRGMDLNAQSRAAAELYKSFMPGMQQQQKEGLSHNGSSAAGSLGVGASKEGGEMDPMAKLANPILRVVEEGRNMHAAAAAVAAAAAAHHNSGGRQPPIPQFPDMSRAGLVGGMGPPGLTQGLKSPSPYDKLHAHESKLE